MPSSDGSKAYETRPRSLPITVKRRSLRVDERRVLRRRRGQQLRSGPRQVCPPAAGFAMPTGSTGAQARRTTPPRARCGSAQEQSEPCERRRCQNPGCDISSHRPRLSDIGAGGERIDGTEPITMKYSDSDCLVTLDHCPSRPGASAFGCGDHRGDAPCRTETPTASTISLLLPPLEDQLHDLPIVGHAASF